MCYILICPGETQKHIYNAERNGDGSMGGEDSTDNTIWAQSTQQRQEILCTHASL